MESLRAPERGASSRARPAKAVQGIDRIDCRHIDAIRAIASSSFSTAWNDKDFAYFLAHESTFSFGVFLQTPDRRRSLQAYFIGLLVQGDLDVISVATAPELRRQGLAASLARFACTRPGVARAFLEVDTENQAAIALYSKLGFQIVGQRKGYYGRRFPMGGDGASPDYPSRGDAYMMRRLAEGRVLN